MKLLRTRELEKGIKMLLKSEKVKHGKVAVDVVSIGQEGCVVEYSIRVQNDNYNEIRNALIKHFPNMVIETEFKFVRGILAI